MIKGFKDFVMGGNLIEIAVAFVMGTIFAALTTAFVDDLISPIIGAIAGKPEFNNTFSIGDGVFKYGHFFTALITFLSTAAAVYFFIVKPYQAMRKPVAESGPSEIDLLTEIRDSLKAGR